MGISSVDEHRKYWNDERNTSGYEENNFSIFDDEIAKTFILKRLDRILHSPDFVVADLGCGPGHILKYLSGKCKEVVKIDFAENMLREAQRRNRDLANIVYRWGDMRNLGEWHGKFDIVIATNSILAGSITESEEMTLEIYKSLRSGGVLVAVMPSVEACNYLARLKFDRCRSQGMSETETIEMIREEFEHEKLVASSRFPETIP